MLQTTSYGQLQTLIFQASILDSAKPFVNSHWYLKKKWILKHSDICLNMILSYNLEMFENILTGLQLCFSLFWSFFMSRCYICFQQWWIWRGINRAINIWENEISKYVRVFLYYLIWNICILRCFTNVWVTYFLKNFLLLNIFEWKMRFIISEFLNCNNTWMVSTSNNSFQKWVIYIFTDRIIHIILLNV